MPKLEDLNLGKPGNADEPMKVDAKGSLCPGPIMSLHDAFNKAIKGQQIIVEATDPGFKKDVTAWSAITGNDITSMTEKDGIITAVMVKKNEFNEIDVPPKENMMTIIVFSDELDKAVAAFNISLGALAVGMEVHLFFTFWGLSMIRKKTGDSKPIDAMLPKGDDGLPLSHDSSEGMGAKMLQQMMKDNNVPPLDFMIHLAKYDGVKFIACQMSMAVLGITEDDLIDGVEIGGVGTMLEFARKSSVNYFI